MVDRAPVPSLLLASASPRRRELLARLRVPFEVLAVDVPEVPRIGEAALEYVSRVARDKARAGRARAGTGAAVLAGDTEVVLDGHVFGKPADARDARDMLRRLSGRTHEVISVVWLCTPARAASRTCVSEVTFANLDAAWIEHYVAGGEPFGKAGAYAIQGEAAAVITRLVGSPSAVMGLPLHATAALLRAAGLYPPPTAP